VFDDTAAHCIKASNHSSGVCIEATIVTTEIKGEADSINALETLVMIYIIEGQHLQAAIRQKSLKNSE
jgi:hypothetical protein